MDSYKQDRDQQHPWQNIFFAGWEDLPKDKALGLPMRWFIATAGALSFFTVSFMLKSGSAVFFDIVATRILVMVLVCAGLGFILAWKREHTGPVRLYISGVALPSLVFFLARLAEF